MKRLLLLSSVALIALSGCGPASPPGPTATLAPPTATLVPTETPIPPTPTPVPSGIDGSVAYSGSSQAGILIFAVDQLPQQNENPSPSAITAITAMAGEIHWNLSPGVYYILAFATIGRPPQGPPLASEPVLNCEHVEVVAGERLLLNVVLTDDDIGGAMRSCLALP